MRPGTFKSVLALIRTLLILSGALLFSVLSPAAAYGERLGIPVPKAQEPKAQEPKAQGPGPLYCTNAGDCEFPWVLPEKARFVVVRLHGEVSLGMAAHVTRTTQSLRAGDVLVLDIKTFGGRVDAAVTIRDALLEVDRETVRTIAFVHPRAISAGALIALATDIIVVSPASSIGAATPVQIAEGGAMAPVEEKIVSYMRAEMRTTAEARGRRGDIAEAMVDAGHSVDGLIGTAELLTLGGKQALEWGIASFEAASIEAIAAKLGYDEGMKQHTVVEVHWSWAERLASWFSGSALSGLLMSIGMLAVMIGLYSGGAPVPLAVGGACLTLFFFGHYVVHLAGFEEILLFGVGLSLLLFEALAPGHLIPGVLGLLMVVAALGLALINLDRVPLEVQWELGWIESAMARVAGSILGAAVLAVGAIQLLPKTSLGRKLILEARIDARAHDKSAEKHAGLMLSIGVCATPLRPSGKIVIAGTRYEAFAESGYIAQGQEVTVVDKRGFALIVRATEKTEEQL